jgi:hypothetical protein
LRDVLSETLRGNFLHLIWQDTRRRKLFQEILAQKKDSKNKIYSLHEPQVQVYCISKGKEGKKYEYGSKASIVMTENSGIIVGAVNFSKNHYDGHTLPEALKQADEIAGYKPDRRKNRVCPGSHEVREREDRRVYALWL